MTLTQLYQFQAIAKCGNMSHVARKLYISQSALSMNLRKLEEELGCTLFDRQKNALHLNDKGRILLKRADIILEQADLIRNDFQKDPGSDPAFIRIQSPLASFPRWLLPRLTDDYPSSKISSDLIREELAAPVLVRNDADIVFSPSPLPDEESFYSEKIAEEFYVIAVPDAHPLSASPFLTYHDIDGMQFTLLQNDSYNYRTFEARLLRNNCHIKQNLIYDSLTYYKMTPHIRDRLMITSSFGQEYFNEKAKVHFLRLEEDEGPLPIYALLLREKLPFYEPILRRIRQYIKVHQGTVGAKRDGSL